MSRRQRLDGPLGLVSGSTDENAISRSSLGGIKGLVAPREKLGKAAGGLHGLKQPSGKGGLSTGNLLQSKTPNSENPLGVYKDPSTSPQGKSGGVRIRKPRLALQNITNATPRQPSGANGRSAGKNQKSASLHPSKVVSSSTAAGSMLQLLPSSKASVSPVLRSPAPVVNNDEPAARTIPALSEIRSIQDVGVQSKDDSAWIHELAAKYAEEDGHETCGMTSDDLYLLLEKQEAEEIKAKVDKLVNLRMPIPPLSLPFERTYEDRPPSPVCPSPPRIPDDSCHEDWISGLDAITMDETALEWLENGLDW